jgi:PIN domain nuclease of toxin-antitoxin system
MNLLLDTHILLWAMLDESRVPPSARGLMAEREAAVHVSAASIWEIAIKNALGKLHVDMDRLLRRLKDARARPLPITWEHAAKVRELPMLHRDPFDRMLVAQALCEPLHLLTADPRVAQYSDELVIKV